MQQFGRILQKPLVFLVIMTAGVAMMGCSSRNGNVCDAIPPRYLNGIIQSVDEEESRIEFVADSPEETETLLVFYNSKSRETELVAGKRVEVLYFPEDRNGNTIDPYVICDIPDMSWPPKREPLPTSSP